MAHRNPALNTLDGQLKRKYPGIVVGWIADRFHNSASDHAEDRDGTVDALDPMIGPAFTVAECDTFVATLVGARENWFRIKYVIWNWRIWFPGTGWQTYDGKDGHTGHCHISSVEATEDDARAWTIERKKIKLKTTDFNVRMPIIPQGTNDADYDGYNLIARVQDRLGITEDGDYGPKTAAAIKAMSNAEQKFTGKVIDEAVYRRLFGLARVPK